MKLTYEEIREYLKSTYDRFEAELGKLENLIKEQEKAVAETDGKPEKKKDYEKALYEMSTKSIDKAILLAKQTMCCEFIAWIRTKEEEKELAVDELKEE